ncbi:MAG: response regulator [Lewinellaceae bacterium]|nr:response regulator [Lewinellaceae bacterium]
MPNAILTSLALCFFHLLPAFFRAQEAALIRLPFDDPLSEEHIRAIVQDRQGLIWMATADGLVKFDGYNYKFFRNNPLDSTSLGMNYVTCLVVDRRRPLLWVGTENCFSKFDLQTETFTNYFPRPGRPGSLPGARIVTMDQDQDGNIWIGSQNGGAIRFDPGAETFRLFPEDPNNPYRIVQSQNSIVMVDGNGMAWAMNEQSRFIQIDPRTWTSKALPDSLGRPLFGFPPLCRDKKGNLLLFTTEGIFRYAVQTEQLTQFPFRPEQWEDLPYGEASWEKTSIMAPLADSQGRLCWGTQLGGYYFYNLSNNELTYIGSSRQNPQKLQGAQVWASFEDTTGAMWLGFWKGGYNRLDPYRKKMEFKAFQYTVGEESKEAGVWRITQGSRSTFWALAFHAGLAEWHPAEDRVVFHPHLERQRPGAVDFSRVIKTIGNGKAWVFYSEANPYLFDNKTSTYSRLQLFPSGFSQPLFFSHPSHLWFDSPEGPKKYDMQKGDFIQSLDLEAFQAESGTTSFFEGMILEDPAGYLWLGNTPKGLEKIDLKKKQVFRYRHESHRQQGVSSNDVQSLHLDQKGNLWIGTYGGGLVKLDAAEKSRPDPRFRHFREYNSDIASDRVYAILEARDGSLWMSTHRGISRFDPETEQFKNYDHTVTGQIFQFTDSKYKGQDGALYFGGNRGVTYFHPDSIQLNHHVPEMVITGFFISNVPVPVKGSFADTLDWGTPLTRHISYTQSITLPYWQNDLSFAFSALSYSRPKENQYAYMLEGYRDEWVEANADNRLASFTNLDPGSYTFRVKGANADGAWNEAGATLQITILPPWWATWWAYALYAAATLAIVFGLFHFQLRRRLALAEARRLQELDAFKTRFYTNITHEFRTPLTIILGLADQIKNQVSEQVKGHLRIIGRNGRQLLRLVNQLLDLSKVESGHLKLDMEQGDIITYLQYLMESFHSYAESRNIRLHFLSGPKEFYMDYDPARLMHIISNLLSNAIKFTPEDGNVYCSVEVLEEQKKLQIAIKDTGIGIPAEQLPFVFERFYSPHSSPPQSSQRGAGDGAGTGIGLALSKELAKLMNGDITVQSELGKGSEFTLTLPVSKRQEIKTIQAGLVDIAVPPEAPAPEPEKRSGRPLMLIVEDNPDLVKYLTGCFKSAYNLEFAYNGYQGFEKATTLIPDIIITDVMMPEMDGLELCTQLKRHHLASHIPIIMLTAKADVDSRLAGLGRGADAYLAKPFLQEELEVRIKALLEQRRKLQAYYRSQAGLFPTKALPAAPSDEEANQEKAFLESVNQAIEANLKNTGFTVEQLAQELFVSPSSLYRKLTALTGMNPNRYIRSFRLAHARELLRKTAHPISYIAFETGFQDARYFSRAFKQDFGMTPTAYRKDSRPRKK